MSGASAGGSGEGGGGGLTGSRAWRKFTRNRMAVASMVVIIGFVLVGVACTVGLITSAEASARVGPDNTPGWLGTPNAEVRLEQADFYRKQVAAALKREDAKTALGQLKLGGRRVAGVVDGQPLSDESLRAARDGAKKAEGLHDEIADILDEAAALQSKISRSSRPDAAEKDRLQPAALDKATEDLRKSEREAEAKLTELNTTIANLIPVPSGWSGTWHKFQTVLGTDRQGRSIALRALYSVRVALQVGFIVALISVIVGTFLGAAAAFFGGWVDHAVTWLYTTFSSIPELVLLSLLAYVFQGVRFGEAFELIPVYAALSLTFWIGPCRVVRGEVLKLKELEYVQAATAIGFGRLWILIRHILPNTMHLMLINFSLLFIGAIKAEVILTFLGLGVKNGASWGIMIEQSRQEVNKGNYWQIGAATALMFLLVLAFNIVSDALQDAFDPKHVG